MPQESDPEDQAEIITPVDALLTRLRSEARPLGREALDAVLNAVDPDDAPALLFDLDWDGLLTDEACTLAGPVWCSAGYPQDCADTVAWRVLFERAGYCIDGVPAQRPRQPLRLYRGSVEARKERWSWTDSAEQATKWAHGELANRPANGLVWTAVVTPGQLLGGVTDSYGRDYVVDTGGLEITELAAG